MALGLIDARGNRSHHTTAAARADAGPARPGLPPVPALDGLRGVAVAAVVVFHFGRLRGGFLGVDLFFVLSGFLITSLLLGGRRGGPDGRVVDLKLFWSRRARRLLPALFLLLAGVAVLIATASPEAQRPAFRGDALATLGYVANWHAMGHQTSYWDIFTQPSPLDHMWSLAIEEQFYLVWPLVVGGLLLVVRRRSGPGHRPVAGVAMAGAVASFTVLALSWSDTSTNRAYYGTDARVGPTLLGAALAALWAGRAWAGAVQPTGAGPTGTGARRAARWWGPALAVVALAVMAAAFLHLGGTGPAYYRGGLALFALAAVGLVALVVSGRAGPVASLLSWRPLCLLGVISYGVYLWHWPVIVYLSAHSRLHGVLLDLACLVVTLVVAGLSFVLVERPIRRGALRGRQVRLALVGAVAAVAALALVVTAGATVPGPVAVAGAAGPKYPLHAMPSPLPATGPKFMLVGDSGPIFLGPAFVAEAEREGGSAASDSQYGCTVLAPEGVVRWGKGTLSHPPCHAHARQAWADMIRAYDPDVVVHYLAALNTPGAVRLHGRWVSDCDPAYDAYLRQAIGEDVDVLGQGGATVALATTPMSPAAGILPRGKEMLDCRNAVYRQVVADHPGAVVVDLAGAVTATIKTERASAFRDAVHLSDPAAANVSRWLIPVCLALRDGRPPPSLASILGPGAGA